MKAILILTFISLSLLPWASGSTEDFFVYGRVYSAVTIDEDSPVMEELLYGVPSSRIIGGENMMAIMERNLVVVTIEDTSNNSILGTYLTPNNGNYSFNFSKSVAGVASIRFIVKELATNTQLFKSAPVTVSPAPAAYSQAHRCTL